MENTQGNDVNNASECNLIYDILNTSKLTKTTNYNYLTILHG